MKIFMLAISTLNSHSVDRFKRQAGGYMGERSLKRQTLLTTVIQAAFPVGRSSH